MKIKKIFIECFLVVLFPIAALAADRADIVVADFEGADYGAWKTTGDAFGKGPARGTLPNQMPVSGSAIGHSPAAPLPRHERS